VSSGSSSGSGADQHLLALLRAIRLRQAAPDAVAAGAADAAAALTSIDGRPGLAPEEGPAPELEAGPPGVRPGWAMSSESVPAEEPAPADEPAPAKTPAPGEELTPAKTPASGEELTPAKTPASAEEVTPAISPDISEIPETGRSFFDRGIRPNEPGYDVEERSGQLSRNRFAGLGAVRRAAEPRTEPEPEPRRNDSVPGRPRWADNISRAPARPPRIEGVTPPMVAPPGQAAPGQAAPGQAAPGRAASGQPSPSRAAPGRASPADGMDPADDALLRQTQSLLRESLAFAGGAEAVAGRLRAALREAAPALLDALPGDAPTQTANLADGLTWLVDHFADPPTLVGGAARLGGALAACGVRPGQLQFVGAALAEALRAGAGPGEWRQEFELAWRSTWQHLHEWILHGEATAADEPPVWTAEVVSHQLRRPDLAVIKLRPFLPMPFRPGQYARIEVERLPGIWRPYSLAGAPRRDDLIELHVRAKTQTGVSGTLVHHTRVGDHVRISRAEGEMGLPERPGRNLLMIAGDTGVAPLKALLTELADTGDERSAVLFWGVRNLAELYDIEEIAEIARAAKRATVVPVVSEGDPGPYASGLVTDAVAAYGEWSRHEVYLAGPPLMLAATSAALRLLGVTSDQIHHDAPE
jgi:NAD(P)H-flavin reductase